MALKKETYTLYCSIADVWLTNGRNGVKAVLDICPDKSTIAADKYWERLSRNVEIVQYIDSKTLDTSNKLQITLEVQLSELGRLKALAEGDKKYSDAINALKEQNKLLALYEEHNKQKGEAFSIPLIDFFKSENKR